MSLINDALKRANQTQRKQPVAGPLGVPIQAAESPGKPVYGPLIVIGAALVLVVSLGAGLIVLGLRVFKSPDQPAPQVAQAPPPAVASAPPIQAPKPPQAVPVVTPNPAPKLAVTPTPTVAPKVKPPVPELVKPPEVVEAAKPVAPAPVATPAVAVPVETPATKPEPVVMKPPVSPAANVPAPAPPAPPKPEFPELTLRGILYNPTRPAALINGKPIFVGGTVSGVKVIAIERDNVTVELAGERKVLNLP